mgnify:CR=1 FL=1
MYQITDRYIKHEYLWMNKTCGWVSIPKNANMMLRVVCDNFNMNYRHRTEVNPKTTFCVMRNPYTRILSGIGEYRQRNLRHRSKVTWTQLLEKLLDDPKTFDEHLEPQVAFMEGYYFTHIMRFEKLLPELLEWEYFKKDSKFIKRIVSTERSQISKHMDLDTILNENKILVDSLVKKYYNQDYEIWLNPTKYLNKKI